MAQTYAAPQGAPPSHSPNRTSNPFTVPSTSTSTSTSTSQPHPPARQDTLLTDDNGIPDEPPPAYTTVAGQGDSVGDVSLAAGPTHIDFSGPPPMPDRPQGMGGTGGGGLVPPSHPPPMHQMNTSTSGMGTNMSPYPTGGMAPTPTGGMGIPGVGYGYARIETAPTGNSWHSPSSQHPPPPRHPAVAGLSSGNASGSGSGSASGYASTVRPPPVLSSKPTKNGGQEMSPTPTEAPTPGRPLLRKGQLLVYPKGHWCSKCQNTGYKAADPSNPCMSDWRKYGRPYSSALAHSYSITPTPNANPSTSSATNFQRPLPNLTSPSGPNSRPSPQLSPIGNQGNLANGPANGGNPYSHLPPPPGSWNQYPGQQGMYQQQQQPYPGQQIFVQHTPAMPPPGALVVGPGDPRIGGRLCNRCNGSGREVGFFGFDDGPCYQCGGLGRVF